MNTLDRCNIIEFPKIKDYRGNLTFIEGPGHIPFAISRTYWIYDVPGGENRSGHANKTNEEVIISLSGAFDVVIDDGTERKTITLNRSYNGLYIPTMVWRRFQDFSTNAVALILASVPYDRDDYIEDYTAFQEAQRG